MPWVKFLTGYETYKAGTEVDLPGRLTWRLLTAGVVERIPEPTVKPVAKKASAKSAKKAK